MGREFGWSAVSDEPMDWDDFTYARQLLAEDRVGKRVREAQAGEDAEFAATRAALTNRRRRG